MHCLNNMICIVWIIWHMHWVNDMTHVLCEWDDTCIVWMLSQITLILKYLLFLVCGPGNFLDSFGSCNPCPLNTFSHISGATACRPCYGGSITLSTGAKNYWDCGRKLLLPFWFSQFRCRAYLFLWHLRCHFGMLIHFQND